MFSAVEVMAAENLSIQVGCRLSRSRSPRLLRLTLRAPSEHVVRHIRLTHLMNLTLNSRNLRSRIKDHTDNVGWV
jgi:hypothetical protein